MAEKKHVIEYIDIIKAFEKVKEKLKNKSNKGHQHGNADITDIDASKIKSGTIDIDRLPKGAIERMVYVKDDAARFALTTNTTQNGDTVKVTSTKKMFYVIDDTKLSSEAGYEPYTAESASAVPWSGVTGKPATFTPEAHTHAISDVTDLQETLTGLRQDVNAKPSKDTNTTYSLTQDSTDGHKLTFKGSDGSTKTVTIPDNDHNDNTTYSLKKTGSKIQLVGSDGSTTEVTDDNTTYDLDAMINALPVGTDDPVDNDYYVSQNADGGTSNTGYFRRPVSKLWNYIKTKLAAVATSGSYTDLSNKPTIGNGKVTVNQNGTTKGTFTMNQTGDTIINLTDNDTDTNTWRDVVDGLDSTRTDASLSANQGRVLNGKFASYLPLSGGDMTGDITFNGHGASTIGSGSQDGAGLDAKNNLNIASWYGVSFTSKCAGFAYSDKPGVSIDCRNGTLAVAGAIYANGGVVGDLTGNAKTATTAKTAETANELKTITLTGTDDNTNGCRLIGSVNVGANWSNYRANFIVRSRHQGNGLLCIAVGCNSNVHNKDNTYAQIRYYGNTSSGGIISSTMYSAYLSPDCKTVYLFWAYTDYSDARLTPVYGSDFEISNGTWMTSIDESTYGTCIAQTEINHADNRTSATLGRNGDESIPMTFNWSGQDGQPAWLWGGEDGSNMYVYNPSNFAVDNAGSIRDSSGNGKLLSASYSKDGLDYSEYTWLAAWNGTELRAVTKGQFATAGHSHGLTHRDLIAAIDTASGGWDLIGGNNGFILKSIRTNASAPKWTIDNFSAAIAFGGADTKGIITIPYNYPGVKFAGGNGDSPRWYFDISGTNEKSYNLDSFLTSHQDISGKLDKSGGTITGRIVKNTNGSWVGDRDRAVVYSMYPGDDSYGCVAGMPTKNGSWTMGNLGGVEHLIFNYVPDANYSANKNESIHVYLRPTEGTIALTSDIPTSLPASDVYAWAKASSKPSYSWSEINGRPTALSSFTNDSGYITGITKAMVTGALGYTPPTTDTNTTYSASTGLNLSGTSFSVKYGSTAGTACQGNDSRLSNSRPASDVYSWAKASSKPSYTWTEISNKPDIPSISKYTPTRTNWTIDSKYNCIVYRIGDFCLAVVAVTGTIYPRQWLPAAQLSKDFTPKTQSSIIISSVGGSDHMECMVTTDGYIKMWWSGSSPATSANICVPYYMG